MNAASSYRKSGRNTATNIPTSSKGPATNKTDTIPALKISRSDVIISDAPINYPKVDQPNILVCLTQAAYNAYSTIVRPGGLLLTDPRFVEIHRKIDAVQHEIPMFENIMEKIGKPIVFNICMLGAVIGLTATVKAESVLTTLATRIPENFLSMNQQALEMGLALTSNSN